MGLFIFGQLGLDDYIKIFYWAMTKKGLMT